MNSRKMTVKMILQKQLTTATPDAAGHIDLSQSGKWEDVTERFFYVMPQSGCEFYRAQKTESNITHLLETHYDDQTKLINPVYRLRITGTDRYLNIVSSMNVDEMNRKIRISCIEAV
jgi:SPP1 family predicted phage head-tail adaptor